jgi:TatD DNase family protein
MFSSAKSREQIAAMPVDRVLTESDGPFTQQDGLPLYPWDANLALDDLASIWSKSASEVKIELHNNLRRLGAAVLAK